MAVAPGIYSGPGNRDITFRGKDLVVRSTSGASVTTIDAGSVPGDLAHGLVFSGSETRSAILEGFTVTGGWAAGASPLDQGGGVLCSGGSPSIRGCVFKRNRAADGGGAAVTSGFPLFEDCVFEENIAARGGGGVACLYSEASQFTRCEFRRNVAGSYDRVG